LWDSEASGCVLDDVQLEQSDKGKELTCHEGECHKQESSPHTTTIALPEC